MTYASRALLKSRLATLGLAADTSEDPLLDVSLGWADEFINGFTHRFFSATRQTRFFGPDALDTSPIPFTPRGGLDYTDPLLRRVGWSQWPYRRLYLDQDLLTIYSVKNGDGTTLPTTGYYAEPRNEVPHYSIWLKSDFSWVWDTDGWVEVDADWGYTPAPSPVIVGCALRLADWHYRTKTPPTHQQPLWQGVITKGSQLPEGFPADVIQTLTPLQRLVR
jgi:hypothetical protein